MGFLSSLFGKKKTQSSKEIRERDCFTQSLYKHLSVMSCFSDSDIQEISDFIHNVPGGFENRGAWHSQIYETFFQPRDWSLPDFEAYKLTVPEWNPFYKVCKKLKVAEKREILYKIGIEFDKKAKNNELFNMLIEKTTEQLLITAKPELSIAFNTEKEKNKKQIYSEFMHHIYRYANSLSTVIAAKELGVKYKFVFFSSDDENKAKHILSKHPDALPPFFPEDRTHVTFDLQI